MRSRIALLLAVCLLTLPGAALAQSAGDEQYADPFGEVERPNAAPEEPAAAPEPAPAPAPVEQPAVASEDVAATQESAAPTLPVTGAETVLVAASGALLLMGGLALRRRALR